MAANANLSLRQLGTPDLNQQALCITFPTLEANATFELKSGLIHLLPSFHGLVGEDLHKHLMKFHVVCTSMKPHGVTQEQIQLRDFPFSSKNAAKHWLYYLPPGSITTLAEMKMIFLEKYFAASRAANIRKEIYGIKHSMLDADNRGVFVNKTPIQARNLIENMAANSHQFGTNRSDPAPRRGNEETRASIQHLNTQVEQLATTISRLEAQNSSNLSSQTVVNSKENVSAITMSTDEDVKESKVEESEPSQKYTPKGKFPALSEYKPVAPFSLALKDSRKDECIKGLYEIFRRCEVNIPLLDAIKQGCQKVELGEQVSAVIRRKTPEKCKDPETVIQVADRYTIYPRGVLEDVLVQVGNLVFPADFYVLDMKNNDLKSPILLGRPFLKTSKSIIDVNNGTLTMEFDGKIVKFNIFDNPNFPSYESAVINLDINDYLSQEQKKFFNGDKLDKVVAQYAKNSNDKIFPSELQAPRIAKNLPPDKDTEIPKKSKEMKHGLKITVKSLKWVKVDKTTRYEPP
ncbi:uncharacterized protein [Henckelia pumila]|uniref:uncharacterized protein n=1 Tax=Henckelia pumila TaxID=405737 RepID=UPI003C6E4861